MEDAEKLELEKKELNKIIGNGIRFSIIDDVVKTEKKLGLFKKKVVTREVKRFVINEPTLGTLMRIAKESIEFDITETAMKELDSISKGLQFASQHIKRMARIIALAVVGSEYKIPILKGNQIHYVKDEDRVEELTRLFVKSMKPSDVYNIIMQLILVLNIGDFINSTRSIASMRETCPNLVEEHNAD